MRPILYTILLLTILTGCRELVTDEFPDFKKTPVLNSILIADSTIKIHVSFTGKIDTSQLKTVDNAIVSLFVNDTLKEQIESTGNGFYESSTIVKEATKYSLEVHIDGYELLTCSDIVPISTKIYNIKHIIEAGKDEAGKIYPAVEFTFDNDMSATNYFEVLIKHPDVNLRHAATLININDPLILQEGLPIALFNNKHITDTKYTMRLNFTTLAYTCSDYVCRIYPYIVEFRSVSYEYYKYRKQFYLYEKGRYPDDIVDLIQPVQLYSNINDAYGIFSVYACYNSDIINPYE